MDESDIRQMLADGRQREAFDLIVDRFKEKIFHLALSFLNNQATASDMSQEALLRVWKALPAYNGSASISTWIYTITRNVCFTELKRAGRRQAVPLDAPESARFAESLSAPESVESTAGLDIETMLSCLSEKYQRVLRLYYLEQKSYEEAAALLGVPLGTVKTNLFRARRELAQMAVKSMEKIPQGKACYS